MFDILYLIPVAALALTLLQAYRGGGRRLSNYAFAIALCVAYALVVMLSSGADLELTLCLMGIAVIGANLIYSYSQNRPDFAAGIVIVLISFAYWQTLLVGATAFIEAFAVGSFVALILKFGYYQKTKREDKKLEKRRDLFQIIIGAIALFAFLFVRQYAYAIVFLLAVVGYAASGLLLNYKAAGILRSMERTGSVFGAGAIYMAVGTMLILGSITSYDYAIVGLIALLICDAVATIVGVHGRRRLPYNKEKTVEGSIAYFAVLAVLGFSFISYYSIVFAAVLALLEGLIPSIDDNIVVPIATIVLYYII
jgi:dolichol kinase